MSLKNENEKKSNPRSKLNKKHAMIGSNEAMPYCPMNDWKKNQKKT